MWQIHFSPDLSEPVALVSTSCGTSCCASLAVASVSAERGDLSSYPSRSFQTLPNSKNEGLCSRWGFLFLPGPPSALQRGCSERQWRMWLWQLWLLQVPRRQVEVGFWSCLEVCIERRRTPNPSLRQSRWFVLFGSLGHKPVLFTLTSVWAARPQHMDLVLEEEVETGVKRGITSWWGGSLVCDEAMKESVCTPEVNLKAPCFLAWEQLNHFLLSYTDRIWLWAHPSSSYAGGTVILYSIRRL